MSENERENLVSAKVTIPRMWERFQERYENIIPNLERLKMVKKGSRQRLFRMPSESEVGKRPPTFFGRGWAETAKGREQFQSWLDKKAEGYTPQQLDISRENLEPIDEELLNLLREPEDPYQTFRPTPFEKRAYNVAETAPTKHKQGFKEPPVNKLVWKLVEKELAMQEKEKEREEKEEKERKEKEEDKERKNLVRTRKLEESRLQRQKKEAERSRENLTTKWQSGVRTQETKERKEKEEKIREGQPTSATDFMRGPPPLPPPIGPSDVLGPAYLQDTIVDALASTFPTLMGLIRNSKVLDVGHKLDGCM